MKLEKIDVCKYKLQDKDQVNSTYIRSVEKDVGVSSSVKITPKEVKKSVKVLSDLDNEREI